MKKTLSLVLVLALLCSFACPVVHAADSDVEKLENAIRVVTDSISEAKQIFPDLKTANTISGMFDEFVSVARNTGTFLSIVNGSVTFLKLIGLVQDSKDEALANIQTQLQAINDQLEATQKQLNTITTQMAQLQASEEFNARTEKAIMLKNNWNDFEYRYVENGMDSLMMQYNGMLLNGMQSWCLNKTADARNEPLSVKSTMK